MERATAMRIAREKMVEYIEKTGMVFETNNEMIDKAKELGFVDWAEKFHSKK